MRRIHELLVNHDTEPLELWVAVLTLLWGVCLLNPWFATFSTSLTWRGLAVLAPEWVWGLIFLALGVTKVWIVMAAANGPTRYVAMAGFALWFFLTVQFLIYNPAGTGWPTFLMVALANGWIYLRHAGVLR